MSVIWIIEKPKSMQRSLSSALQGDFPVRSFGSVDSFTKLQKIHKSSPPNLIITDMRDFDQEIRWLDDLVGYFLPSSKRVYLNKKNEVLSIENSNRIKLLGSFSNNFELSKYVRCIIGKDEQTGSKAIIRHRDLMLDFDKLVLVVLPDNKPAKISLKEARILKFFMSNIGQCLTREDIKKEVWQDLVVSTRTIDSHISRLRKRISYAEAVIESIYGGGYIFK